MTLSRIRINLLILFISFVAYCTYGQQIVLYPGITGKQLRDSLKLHYKCPTTYTYDQARDTIFAYIYNNNEYVFCVYTGDSIYIDASSPIAPRTQAHNLGFNTEHSYPQSKGAATGNPQSDLHHLAPTRADVNSSRGNLPYMDIPDSLVNRWWRLNTSQTNLPDTLKEEYSKRASFGFEVRDKMKGNMARKVFYFYTMYNNEAENADPDFFKIQLKTLKRWHHFDVPDANEYDINVKIAQHQASKLNPFIIDTTLVERAFGISPPESFTLNVIDETTIKLKWEKTPNVSQVIIVRNQSGLFPDPIDGIIYQNGYSSYLNGQVYITDSDSIIDIIPQLGTYYYKIYTLTDTNSYSVGLMRFTTTGFTEALHYWNFNHNVPDVGLQWPDSIFAFTGIGLLTHNFVDIQSFQGSILNALSNDIAGGSFSPRGLINNERYLTLDAPTSQYRDIVFSYVTKGTNTGYNTQSIYYSTDGISFDSLTSSFASNFDWTVRSVDFTSIEEANNNPNFKIRIVIRGASHALGNNRFDNLKIIGNYIQNINNEENNNFIIELYPNPCSHLLHINIKTLKPFDKLQVTVYNSLGQPQYKKEFFTATFTIPIKDFPNGFYVLDIRDAHNRVYRKKFIKN